MCWLLTKQISPNVIDDDQRAWQQKPHQPVKDIADKEAGGNEDNQQDHVGPGVLPKLVHVHAFLQPQHKCHKACIGIAVFKAGQYASSW